MNGVLLSLLLLLLSMVRLNAAPGDTITVLVAYTIPAEENFNLYDQHCNTTIFPGAQAAIIPHIYSSINELIDSCMADLNATIQNTKITNPATGRTPFFRLVCRMRTKTNIDSMVTNTTTMSTFRARFQDIDEWFNDVDSARNLHNADITHLIFYSAHSPHSGLAGGTSACISLVTDVAFGLFTHETGHLLGLGPDGGSHAGGLWGIHPDAGVSRSTNAIWHTQTNNIVPEFINFSTGAQSAHNLTPWSGPGIPGHTATLLYNPNGTSAEGCFHFYKTSQVIPVWSTNDTSVYWRGIQIASANRAPQNDAATIRSNLVSRSNQRLLEATETLENITITSERFGIVEASSSITLNPGTTISEGADMKMAIVAPPSAKMVMDNDNSALTLMSDSLLLNVSPNPFNSKTYFSIVLPKIGDMAIDQEVSLNVFAPNGQLIRTLIDGRQSSGRHSCVWDGKDCYGRDISTGLYLVRLKIGRVVRMHSLIYMK